MSNEYCPFIKKTCVEHKCKFYIQILGQDNNTGEDISRFDCSFALMPVLTIENSNQQRQTAAAIESFRNEVALGNAETARLIATNNLIGG